MKCRLKVKAPHIERETRDCPAQFSLYSIIHSFRLDLTFIIIPRSRPNATLTFTVYQTYISYCGKSLALEWIRNNSYLNKVHRRAFSVFYDVRTGGAACVAAVDMSREVSRAARMRAGALDPSLGQLRDAPQWQSGGARRWACFFVVRFFFLSSRFAQEVTSLDVNDTAKTLFEGSLAGIVQQGEYRRTSAREAISRGVLIRLTMHGRTSK